MTYDVKARASSGVTKRDKVGGRTFESGRLLLGWINRMAWRDQALHGVHRICERDEGEDDRR